MKIVREYINEKFKEESDPIHDMDIGIKEAIKYKLGLEYGKDLPEIFRNKYFYAYGKYDRLIKEGFEDQYLFMEFYDIVKINDQWLIQTCWNIDNRHILNTISYPVDQFEKELNS